MTKDQAKKEARRRWGAAGHISRPHPGDYRVGRLQEIPVFGGIFEIKGRSTSWEAAFSEAEKKREP